MIIFFLIVQIGLQYVFSLTFKILIFLKTNLVVFKGSFTYFRDDYMLFYCHGMVLCLFNAIDADVFHYIKKSLQKKILEYPSCLSVFCISMIFRPINNIFLAGNCSKDQIIKYFCGFTGHVQCLRILIKP